MIDKRKNISEFQKRELEISLSIVAGFFDVTTSDIKGLSRESPLPTARYVFISYCVDEKSMTGPPVTKFINRTPAMTTYAKHKTLNNHDLKPIYMKFLSFLQDKDTIYYISKIESFEMRLKITHIHKLILDRFKTVRFRDQMESRLKDIIFIVDGKNKFDSLVSLFSWFDDFSNEFFDNPEQMMDEFEKIGK